MKVIITKRFKEKYLEKNRKYFSEDEFWENLVQKYYSFIKLHHPFFKFKNKIRMVSFRGVGFYYNEDSLVPLFVYLKKDKNFGENISWDLTKNLIEDEFELSVIDIENGDFEIFEK